MIPWASWSGRLPVTEKIGGSSPLGIAARGDETEVCPTLARGLPLKQVYVGSIPTASTCRPCRARCAFARRAARAEVRVRPWCSSNTPLFQSGFAGANPAGCTVGDRLIYERAHDVAVAYRLAMADVWVRLPLGALVGDELIENIRPCDVVAACRLGMTDVWVRFPPGALFVNAGHGTPTGSCDQAQTLVCVGSNPSRATPASAGNDCLRTRGGPPGCL